MRDFSMGLSFLITKHSLLLSEIHHQLKQGHFLKTQILELLVGKGIQ